MLADLWWGVLVAPLLEVAEVPASGPPVEVVPGPPLEDAAGEERDLGLGVVRQVEEWQEGIRLPILEEFFGVGHGRELVGADLEMGLTHIRST